MESNILTPSEKLIRILKQLQNVILAIRNEPDGIIPKKHHSTLGPAIDEAYFNISLCIDQIQYYEYDCEVDYESFLAMYIEASGEPKSNLQNQNVQQEIEKSWKLFENRVQRVKKALFEAGLATSSSLEFKDEIIQTAFDELKPHLIIPIERKGIDEASMQIIRKFARHSIREFKQLEYEFGNIADEEIDVSQYEAPEPPPKYHGFKKIIEGMKGIHKKVKNYLGTVNTVVKSMSEAFPILELVNETVGLMSFGFNVFDDVSEIHDITKQSKEKDERNEDISAKD